MTQDSDASGDLDSRLTRGDEAALAEAFSLHRDRLRRMVSFRLDQRLSGRVDASDILQEAYIDATQRLHHFANTPMSVFVWLRQVTTQRLIDVHRRHLDAQRRDAKQEVSIQRAALQQGTSASVAMQLVDSFISPSQAAIRAELVSKLESVLEEMDPLDREVLALRHFEELTNNEVAEVLGIQKSTASNRYVRALSRLRKLLTEIPGFVDDAESRGA